jgi:hypothetical protein
MISFLRSLVVFMAAIALAGCGGLVVVDRIDDVTGTIVDFRKTPWPNRQILVGDTLTTTDEAGHFTVHNVAFPYNLAIAAEVPSGGHNVAIGDVFVGMSDPAPTVSSWGHSPISPVQSGSTTVTVVLPAADTSTVLGCVAFDNTDNLTSISVISVALPPGPATLPPGPVRKFHVEWTGPPSATVRIHAFQTQVDPATSAPVHYLGYDTTDIVLADHGDVSWTANYKPPPFSESPLSVTVSLPEGYTMTHTALTVNSTYLADNWGQLGSSAKGPVISFVVPDLPGVPLAISVGANDGNASAGSVVAALPAGPQPLALQVDPAPTLTSPTEGATFGVGSTITWTLDGPGAPSTFLSMGDGRGGQAPFITLWGGEDGSVTLPDLSALGLPLPHGMTGFVGVRRDSRERTLEDYFLLSSKPWSWGASTSSKVTTP